MDTELIHFSKKTFFVGSAIALGLLLISCSSDSSTSPTTVGRESGKDFVILWNSDYGTSVNPTEDMIVEYCVNSMKSTGERYSWNNDQLGDAVYACGAAAAAVLD